MARINIRELKANLSAIVERVSAGETVVVWKRNQAVAELRPIARPAPAAKRLGRPVPGFSVPPAFFDPLPDDVVRAFE